MPGARPPRSVGDGDLVDRAVDDPPRPDPRLAGHRVGLVVAERDQDVQRIRVNAQPDVGRRRGPPGSGRASGRSPRRPRRRRRSRSSAGAGRRGRSRSGTARPPCSGSARSGAPRRRRPPGRSPTIRPHASFGYSARAWSIDRVADAAGRRPPGPGARMRRRRSPPVDAALERLVHLVEVRRERAGREVLPAAVGQQRDDRAGRHRLAPREPRRRGPPRTTARRRSPP